MAETIFLLDTNIILRFLLDDHPIQSPKATGFLKRVATNEIKAEVPAFIIAECIYVLSKFYGLPKSEIVESLSSILDYPGIINPDRHVLLNALLIFQKNNCPFPDCLLAAMSTLYRRVVSFDYSDFNKLNVEREIL